MPIFDRRHLLRHDPIRPIGASGRNWQSTPRTHASDDAWPLLGPLAALVAGWIAMAWPWLSGRVTIPWDAKAQFLPQIQFLAQSIARGESPFWAPYVFSGQVQVADPQSMIFSPPFLLLALVNGNPSAWAVDIVTLLAGLAGAAALLVWFRDQGWHWAGALIAGLAFCFGASMAWRLQHVGQVLSLAYLPMALLALERTMSGRSYAIAVVLAFIGAAIVLGRDQVAMLVLYLLAAYTLWRLLGSDRPSAAIAAVWKPLGLAAVVAACLAVVPLVLTLLLASDSNRPSIDLEGAGRGSLHPALLITALVPQLFGAAFRMEDYWGPPSFAWPDSGLYIAQNMGQIYIGALPLLLIVTAAVRGQMWTREIRFFSIAFAVVLLYALGWYTPIFRLLFTIVPGVDLYRRPADATFVIGALAAILAGYATHRLFEQPWQKLGCNGWLAVAVTIALGAAVALDLAIWRERLPQSSWPLLAAAVSWAGAVSALAYARPRMALEPWIAALALAGVTTIDLAWNNGPSSSSGLPPEMYDVLDPATRNPVIAELKSRVAAGRTGSRRDRIELLGLGYHWPNASLTHRLENTLGANPVRLKLYSEATGADDTIGLPDQRKFTPLLPSYRSLLVDMLGLRYVAAGTPLETIDPKLKSGDWPLVAKAGDTLIYENPRAMPRVMFAKSALHADFANILQTGQWPAFDPTVQVLLENVSVPPAIATDTSTAPAIRIAHYGHDAIDIEVESNTAGYVILNDVWQPWWFASVDGRPAPVLRANVLFRAVAVTAGKHAIRFVFRPFYGAWQQLNAASETR